MIKSMTGYGQAYYEDESLVINIEIKTLNSKFLDCMIRPANALSYEKEIAIRNLITKTLVRGKVSITLEKQEKESSSQKVSVNENLFKTYYKLYDNLATDVNASKDDIFRLAIQSPEVMLNSIDDGQEEQLWKLILNTVNEALDKCNQFREQEGSVLREKLAEYTNSISSILKKVDEYDPVRIENVKKRVGKNLKEFIAEEKIDENRFEQELLYYIEKLDIAEEKVRLKNHIEYFLTILNGPTSLGKKLGFISQEMGREINTIGSKANDSTLQQLVVNMKEELEKIKEQVLNVL